MRQSMIARHDRLAEQVRERYGSVNLLVNNAGITRAVPHGDLDSLDDDLIDQIFRVNWRGAFATVGPSDHCLSRAMA